MSDEQLHVDVSRAVALLRGRRTVAQVSLDRGRAVPHRLVREAIASAICAPNHHRTEPWRFAVLDRDRIVRLGEVFANVLERGGSAPAKVAAKRREWGEAPGVLVLVCVSAPDADEVRRREDFAACCCAAQNLMLHLWGGGVASKWSTGAVWDHEDFWATIGLPAEGAVVGVFFYGFPLAVPELRRSLHLDDVLVDHLGR